MDCWDTVVIGSGSGGLTAAVALARAGQRMIVLERHYLPGGWMHSFSLDGYLFSPGVHYIGELGPGGSVRRLYEGLGLSGDLEFCELNPDGFDHLLIGGERFEVPKGLDRYMTRLKARFPGEAPGIDRYFDTIRRINAEVARLDTMLGFPKVPLLPFKSPCLLRWGLRTQEDRLDALRGRTPWQLGPLSFQVTSRIPRLYLIGASMLSHGVAGAAMSGLTAAQRITGAARIEDLLAPADGSLRVYPADRPEERLHEQAPQRGAAPESGDDEPSEGLGEIA